MYVADFSINVLTLLGIVLAIGMVVDDAIIVLENIYTKIENKMDPIEAGKKGSAEIFFAVISTTIALAAVFMPVIFLQGITGRLFQRVWNCSSWSGFNICICCFNINSNVKL